jgi:predicted nuclease of predicted toxin-antitoxin system
VSAKILADENLKGALVRGLRRQKPDLDIVRVQDVGLLGADDPAVLAWAAVEDRVLLTHDVRTITKYAYDRLVAGLPMPGVIEVRGNLSIGQAIEDILLLVEFEEEWRSQVRYIPLG